MIKIKKIMAAVLSIALVGAFTSCGGDEGASSESKSGNASVSDSENKGGEKEENSGEDVTIKISWWGGDTRHEATQNAINAFMEENENINIDEEIIEVKEEHESTIKIADDVVAVLAGVAVSEVPGVAGMAGGFAGGISEVLSGKKNLAKGIKVEVGEKDTKIDVNIIVEYGVRIPDVAFEIQNRVKKAVEAMTGLIVSSVNIHIQGINIAEKRSEEQTIEE